MSVKVLVRVRLNAKAEMNKTEKPIHCSLQTKERK